MNFLIVFGLLIVFVRIGKLITEKDVEKGFSFLPDKIKKLVIKLFVSKRN